MQYSKEYNELADAIRSGEIDLTNMSDADIQALAVKEFRLKWLASKEATEQLKADTEKEIEAMELRKSILCEEAQKKGYSGDHKGTLEDWIKYCELFKDNHHFYGLKSKNDKMMKVESFKRAFIEKRAKTLLEKEDINVVTALLETGIIKYEDNPRFQALPSDKDKE